LKLAGAAHSGGDAKHAIQAGLVSVNGAVEVRRSHPVKPGDVVTVEGQEYRVCSSPT
jgi:ribosome-associated protein